MARHKIPDGLRGAMNVRSQSLFKNDPAMLDLYEKRFEMNLEHLCQRIGRIITQDFNLKVRASRDNEMNGSPAGLIDGQEIMLDHRAIQARTHGSTDRVAVTIALLMHELGHHQHTPGQHCSEWQGLNFAQFRALNALEDGRQERLISGRYPKMEDYFRLCAARFILKMVNDNPGLAANVYPLIKGRQHLFTRKTLRVFKKAFAARFPNNPEVITRVDDIISEYQKIQAASPNDRIRMADLAKELAAILLPPPTDNCLPMHGNVRGKATLQEIRQDADGAAQQEKGRIVEVEVEEGEGETDSVAQGSSAASGDPIVAQMQQTRAALQLQKEVKEALEEEEDSSMENLENQVSEQMASANLKRSGKGIGMGDPMAQSTPTPVKIDASLAKRIERAFSMPLLDLRMEERRRQRSGRVDMNHLSAALISGSTRIFQKRRRDITTNASMAIHVALDYSSSMSGIMNDVLTSGGTLMKGLEGARHNTKLSVFSDGWQVLKDWEQTKVSPVTISSSGTQPAALLKSAVLDFQMRKFDGDHHQLMIIVTDGGWVQGSDKYVEALRREGVVVITIDFTGDVPEADRREVSHGENKVFHVNGVAQLAETMRDVVGEMSKKAIEEARSS